MIGLTNVGTANCEKKAFELVELEEQVKRDKGVWIRFFKAPPVAESEAAGGKKAPSKGAKGGAASDEQKPIVGRAWISFDEMLQPGTLETKQRVYLETCPPLVKKTSDEGAEEEVEE